MAAMSAQLLPAAQLAGPTPSAADGVAPEREREARAFCAEVVHEGAVRLEVPSAVTCTGQNLMQRFWHRRSLLRFDAYTVAMACLFLACKVEEAPKRLREVLYVFHAMALDRAGAGAGTGGAGMELGGDVYNAWRTALVRAERHVLRELGFGFYHVMDHPHKFILYYVKLVGGDAALAQRAWNHLNDAMRTDFCLRYRPETMACAAIELAAREAEVALPRDPAPWWSLFKVDTAEMNVVMCGVLTLQALPSPRWLESMAGPEEVLPLR